MTEHLVVLPEDAIRALAARRRPTLAWSRRRREPPVGAVRAGDTLFFKVPGGDVIARAAVAAVAGEAAGGKIVVRMRLKNPTILVQAFPVVKHDRRSWVVCAARRRGSQQSLLAFPDPTLADVLRAVSRHVGALPARRDIERALRAHAAGRAWRRDPGVLLVIAALVAIADGVTLTAALEDVLRAVPVGVFPLAVFSPRARGRRVGRARPSVARKRKR